MLSVVGGEMYVLAGLVGMERGSGVDFSRDTWRGPKDGIGLVLVFGVMVGKGLVDIVANFDIFCKTYIGYSPSSWASEILPHHVLKLLQDGWLNIQFPVPVLAHFMLHLVYLPQLEHPLPNYAPGLVQISVVTEDLCSDHEG